MFIYTHRVVALTLPKQKLDLNKLDQYINLEQQVGLDFPLAREVDHYRMQALLERLPQRFLLNMDHLWLLAHFVTPWGHSVLGQTRYFQVFCFKLRNALFENILFNFLAVETAVDTPRERSTLVVLLDFLSQRGGAQRHKPLKILISSLPHVRDTFVIEPGAHYGELSEGDDRFPEIVRLWNEEVFSFGPWVGMARTHRDREAVAVCVKTHCDLSGQNVFVKGTLVVPYGVTKFLTNAPIDYALDEGAQEFSMAVDATPNHHGHGPEEMYALLRGSSVMPVRAYQARTGDIPGMDAVRRRFLASLG